MITAFLVWEGGKLVTYVDKLFIELIYCTCILYIIFMDKYLLYIFEPTEPILPKSKLLKTMLNDKDVSA